MNQLFKFLLVLMITVMKVLVLLLLIVLAAMTNYASAQNVKNKKNPKELNVYARVKDHISHLDIDSTVTARLLSGSDSSAT